MILLIVALFITPIFAQVNKPYSSNVQWVDFVRPVSISSTPVNVEISTPLATEVVNFPQVQTVSVNNFPQVQIVSGTVNLNDTMINRVVIRDSTQNRNLTVNTYNGLDVRLMNNTGTLISSTNPLPVNISSSAVTLDTNILNTPNVNVTNDLLSVNITSTTVTLNTNLVNTPDVNVANTPNVNVVNNPFVQADPYYMASSTFVVTNVTDFVVKPSYGCIYHVTVGVAGTSSILKIYDGNKQIAEIDTTQQGYYPLQCRFDTNLTITTEGTTPAKITIVYK